jgi:hypothetical protein
VESDFVLTRAARPLLVAAFFGLAFAENSAAAASQAAEEAEDEDGAKAEAEDEEENEDGGPSTLETYYPPPVDGPAIRLPVSPTRLYFDGGYGISRDLSALPYIAGSAWNLRFALGGVWRWRGFSFDAEIPFANVTTIDITALPGMPDPTPEDAHQTRYSFGDVRLGVNWTAPLVGRETLVGGLGLRGHMATHSTRFLFHLRNGATVVYVLPYYFHIEPTLILGGALGRFSWVLNQGAIALVGPDGDVGEIHIVVPTIYFYDAHYAVAYAPVPFLGFSVELATTVQLNHVSGVEYQDFNNVRAAWVAPAIQIHAGAYRIDLIGRYGLTRGQELYGVLQYAGTHSATLRITRTF